MANPWFHSELNWRHKSVAKLKQKTWMTVPSAARYLTDIVQDEIVTETDILQYALDEELTLSIRINSWPQDQRCLVGELAPMAELVADSEKAGILSSQENDVSFFRYSGGNYAVAYRHKSVIWPGTYDLVSDETTKNAIASLWLRLLEGSAAAAATIPVAPTFAQSHSEHPKSISDQNLTLIDAEEGEAFLVNTNLIPSNSYFIIRKKEVDSLLEGPSGESPATPSHIQTAENPSDEFSAALSTTQENTLYKMILGMAITKYEYAPNNTRNKATGEKRGSIYHDLEQAGVPVDADTIRKHLQIASERHAPLRS